MVVRQSPRVTRMVTTAPYGSWRSAVEVDDLTAGSVGLDAVRVGGDDLYWLESHPAQAGRVSLWRRPFAGGDPVELTPAPVNVRTRVNEYGGGEYGVRDGGVVYSGLTDGGLGGRGPAGPVPPSTPPSPTGACGAATLTARFPSSPPRDPSGTATQRCTR